MNTTINYKSTFTLSFSTLVLLALALISPVGAQGSNTTQLSENGVALQKVIVAATASEETRTAANTLADYLGRISGAKFNVETGDGTSGIVVGTVNDFPALKLQKMFAPAETFRREEYLLRSLPQKVLLIGATDIAVRDAVWDFLRRLGYRQFFPGETWEVIPKTPSISINIDTFEKPDFYTRLIWYGHGMWDYNKQPYADWCARNRAFRAFKLQTSHSYQAIIRRNPEVFKAHPEYLALVDGKRQGTKFCISNPDLRKFVIEHYALAHFRNNPDSDCVSLEPSDGGGWCECDKCKALGSVSDRVLLLANEAADAIKKHYPGKYVAFLAYNEQSPPPSIRVHSNVIVKIQTSFIRGGFTLDELISGWQEKGANIGIGEYYSVFQWDQSRPAEGRGSDLARIVSTIPQWHQKNAHFFMSESSDNWGVCGLGYYLAAQLLWDTSQAEQFDALIDDFLTKSFGPAKAPMSEFFHLIYLFDKDDARPMIRSDMLARMYRFLAQAKELAQDNQAIIKRLDDLTLLTRYEELFQQYANANGAKKKEALKDVIRHAYRMRETMMIHAKPIFMHLGGKQLTKQERNLLKDTSPFTRQELDRFVASGVTNTQTVEVGFEPINFSRDLIPATALHLRKADKGFYNNGAPVGSQRFYTWLKTPGEIKLRVSGGWIKHYRDIASNVQTSLIAMANPMLGEAVAKDESVAPDGIERTVTLKSTFEGLHQVKVWPPSNRAKVMPEDESTFWTMESSLEYQNRLSRYWSLYFYVPKGTKVVGGFARTRRGALLDSNNKPVFSFSDATFPGYFHCKVPPGQDGKLWKIDRVIGKVVLMTVPPFLAPSAGQLLLPREVVKADATSG